MYLLQNNKHCLNKEEIVCVIDFLTFHTLKCKLTHNSFYKHKLINLRGGILSNFWEQLQYINGDLIFIIFNLMKVYRNKNILRIVMTEEKMGEKTVTDIVNKLN